MPDDREPLLPPPRASSSHSNDTDLDEASHERKSSWTKWIPVRKSHIGPMELTRGHRWGILAGIWTANFLSALNSTLVTTLLSSISSEFKQANQASWLGTSFLLATCTFTPLYGRLSNAMGRRGANQTALIFAGTGVLLCGLSKSMPTLILARFVAGIGSGGIFTTASVITSDMYSMRDRGVAQGISSVFNGLGLGLGGPIGGLINDKLGWRWAFLLQLPLFFISFMLTSVNLTYTTPGKGKSARDILRRIDYQGITTLLLSIGSILAFLSFKFNEDLPWSDWRVLVPFILSILSPICFVWMELYVSLEPIMAPFLLKQKDPVLISTSNLLVALCNFSINYFFPIWFQTVNLDSATTAGLHIMPNSLSISVGSLAAGWIMHKTGEFRKLMIICGIMPFVAGIFVVQMKESSGIVSKWLSIIPLGFGNAVVLQCTLIALLTSIPKEAMAVATGFGQLFRGIGQVLGVAISFAVFQAVLDRELHQRIVGPGSQEMIQQIRQSSQLVLRLPPDLQRAARDSYAIALRVVFTTAAACTLTAYIVRLFITPRSLDDEQESSSSESSPPCSPAQTPINEATTLPIQTQPSETPSRYGTIGSLPRHVPQSTNRPRMRPVKRRISTYDTGVAVDVDDDVDEGQSFARSFETRPDFRRTSFRRPQPERLSSSVGP